MVELKKALERIVRGRDFSVAAVKALESEIVKYEREEWFENLENILALYSPGGGEFLFGEKTLELECTHVLKLLDGPGA